MQFTYGDVQIAPDTVTTGEVTLSPGDIDRITFRRERAAIVPILGWGGALAFVFAWFSGHDSFRTLALLFGAPPLALAALLWWRRPWVLRAHSPSGSTTLVTTTDEDRAKAAHAALLNAVKRT